MTSLDFLIIAAGVQAGFLVALVVLIVLTRLFWLRRRARTAAPQAELEQAFLAWMRGEVPVLAVLRPLRRLPKHVALDTLIHLAARLAPNARQRLGLAVANERWARALRAGARSRYWWRRLEAGRLLSVAGRAQDVRILLRLLADPHPAVVIAVIGALEQVESPALLAAVLDRLPHLAPTVQSYTAVSLQRVRGQLLGVLGKYLAGKQDRPGLSAYVELAGWFAAPELEARLTWLADHEDVDIRVSVARALGRYKQSESVEALRRLAEDRAWQVRAQAIQSLGKLAAPVVPLFQAALRDSSWWVRLRGALALARAGAQGRDALLAAEIGTDTFARDMARLILGLPPAALAEYQR